MADYFAMDHNELTAEKTALEAQYKKFQDMNLKLNMARGKPGPHQMDLAMDLLKMDNYTTDNGFDARNYGELEGLPEARALFADVIGVKPGEVFVGGNSSLQLMYNLVGIGIRSVSRIPLPVGQVEHRKFLCPVPGYDRHFGITEELGFELITVPMTPTAPTWTWWKSWSPRMTPSRASGAYRSTPTPTATPTAMRRSAALPRSRPPPPISRSSGMRRTSSTT